MRRYVISKNNYGNWAVLDVTDGTPTAVFDCDFATIELAKKAISELPRRRMLNRNSEQVKKAREVENVV